MNVLKTMAPFKSQELFIETLSGVKAALRGTAYKSILKIHRMAEVITTEAA